MVTLVQWSALCLSVRFWLVLEPCYVEFTCSPCLHRFSPAVQRHADQLVTLGVNVCFGFVSSIMNW